MRISPTTDIYIKDFSAGEISRASSYVKNGIFDRYPDGRTFVTQRPGINIFENHSGASDSDSAGRGIYYWSAVSAKYIVNLDTVYKSAYSAPLGVGITEGTERVYFFEVGDYLVILDPENNEGWYINSSASTTLAQITDVHFPTEQTPALQLAKGGAVLNGRLYVYTTDGDIYESDIEDPTSWNPLNFRNSEIAKDGGVFLAKHHEHIVAVGNRSMEFFYDAANPVGSSLNPRTDIFYEIGSVSETSFWVEGDMLFWCALTPSGGVEVQVLENFVPRKISQSNIDSYLNSAVTTDMVKLMGSGFRIGGNIFYILTLYNVISAATNSPLLKAIVPVKTLVYNVKSQTWTVWVVQHPGYNDCPIMAWARQSETRTGEGIMANGDLITIADDNNPVDTNGAFLTYESGIYEADIYSGTGQSGVNIIFEIVFGPQDYGTRNRKFMSELVAVGTPTETSQQLLIYWSDESDNTWKGPKVLDTSKQWQSIKRMGKFRQRNLAAIYQGDEQYRLEALETRENA